MFPTGRVVFSGGALPSTGVSFGWDVDAMVATLMDLHMALSVVYAADAAGASLRL